ncbi:MAG: AAA family ATPase [Lachnospiraceae bacterium]|nr:AAA family ATPase [Lachnospiraceae bacterium]
MSTIAEAKMHITNTVRQYLYKDESGDYVMVERNRQPIYLEGPPGIGKTEIVEQVSKELGIGYVGSSLAHLTRNSLLGLPVIEELESGRKYTTYTVSEVLAQVYEKVEQGYKEGILLLDEFTSTSETIMPTMLGFLQTKNIGVHTLPEGWVIVLCGNPPEYNRTARKFDCAVLDRIRKITIEFDAKTFIAYGREIGLEKTILDYLEVQPSHAYRCVDNGGEKELVTCRGWENLSRAYSIYAELEQTIDLQMVKQFIKSEEIADSFMAYVRQCNVGVSFEEMDEILRGRGFEKNLEKVKGLTYRQQWLLSEYLCERMLTKETKEEAGLGRYKEIAGWIDNALDMLYEADEKGVLAEKVFGFINKNEELLKVVSNVKCRRYLEMCEKVLGDVGA